jgi:hypothetical protein
MKIHYPPKAEDALSMIDRIFDRAVEASKPIQALAVGLRACAEQLQRMGETVALIAHNQAVHHQMIKQMWGIQQHIFRKLQDNSLDVSMPDIDAPKKVDPKDEATLVRKKAEQKPN